MNISDGEQGRTMEGRQVVPMRVGSATVYIAQSGAPVEVATEDAYRPVALPTPQEAFDTAGEIVREGVRIVGERLHELAAQLRPSETTVEFTVTFDVRGKASPIPLFVTGEAGVETGLKVTAVWRRSDMDAAETPES